MRLFKAGCGKCEARKYDQHFYLTAGQTQKLKGFMIDDVRMPISEWTLRHNRWSDAEVEEQSLGNLEHTIKGKLSGNPVEKKRFLRGIYDRCPIFIRPFCLFFYRYIIRCGILDGSEGFVFWVLQAFWFHFLIDAKLFERKLAAKSTAEARPESDRLLLGNLRAHSDSND
jgi:hypothetical protein